MDKIKLSTAASITSSPLNALPNILTNGNKIHHSSLAKVGAERGQTARSCLTERKSKLCRKECASQVFKMTTWWQFFEITMAKSRKRFEGWLHRKLDRLGSKWTSGFTTKKSGRLRTWNIILVSAWTVPLFLPSLVKTGNAPNPSSSLNESSSLSWDLLNSQTSDDWRSSLVFGEEHSSTLLLLFFWKSQGLLWNFCSLLSFSSIRGNGLYQKNSGRDSSNYALILKLDIQINLIF